MEVPTEIFNRYVKRVRTDLNHCMEFLQSTNFKDIEVVGHQLKGNGSTFGHPEISDIGFKLESGALNHDPSKVEFALNELSSWLRNYQ